MAPLNGRKKCFAEDTSVSVGRSRGEIDDLLRSWGADGIRWTDHFTEGNVCLEFLWTHQKLQYLARFSVQLPDRAELEKRAIDGRSNKPSENKLRQLLEARGRWEHRVLLLWLKACFNAIEAGIVTPEVIFLPFLVGKDGRTVAEVAVPKLSGLLAGSAGRLLSAGGGT